MPDLIVSSAVDAMLSAANNAAIRTAIGISTVGNTGDYNDLTNKPDLSVFDELITAANLASFPGTGDSSKLYLAQDSGLLYRWNGSAYADVTGTLALGETNTTAYRGDRGKTAYDHSQATGNPHGTTISDISGLQTDLDSKVNKNSNITGATKTKITYDAKGLVTSGADATTADIADSTNRRYVTDAQQTVLNNTSGVNTGDQINITGNAATVTTNANLTGHVTSVGNAAVLGSFTKAELSTAVSDGNVLYVGDAPTAHAASHKTGGADAIKLDELAAPTDVTTLNATTSAHGLLPKLSGVSTEFLNGVGAFATPGGASWPALDGTQQTGNFNFGSTSRIVPISLAAGNITGTLPDAPTDGQIFGVVAQGLTTANANRFSLGLNGKTINGGNPGFATRTSVVSTSLAQLYADLGVTGSTVGESILWDGTTNAPSSTGGSVKINFLNANNYLRLVVVIGSGGGTLSFKQAGMMFPGETQYRINGGSWTNFTGGTSAWTTRSIALAAGTNTVDIGSPLDYNPFSELSCNLDDFSITNAQASPPAAWTDISPWRVAAGGSIILQWSAANSTWQVLDYVPVSTPTSDNITEGSTNLFFTNARAQSAVTSVTGNAGSATVLQTARNINGVSFNGSANITVPAAGSTLTDTVPINKGGTGLTALGTGLQVFRTNADATAAEWATLGGVDFTPDTSAQTSNFTFGSGGVGWNVPVDLSSGNIVGTLPASPTNGRIVRVYGRGINGSSSNRFTFNLNGSTFNGAAGSTTSGSTGFESGNFNTTFLTELKCVSASTSFDTSSTFSIARTGSRGYQCEDSVGGPGWIEMVFNVATGGATFSYWHRANGGTTYAETVNGVTTNRTMTSTYTNRTISLSAGTNTIRLAGVNGGLNVDDLSINNLVAAPPSDWTDTASRNIGPRGYVELQYSSANSTWHVVQHSVLGNYEMPVIAGTNAAVSMIANCHYQLDGSILTADRTYTLPAGVPGDRVRVSLTNGNASWECIISGASGVTINGGAAATEWSRLFIAREYVEFVATSSTNWDVWDDGRIPQVAEMTLASSISNHFANNAYTKVPFDTVGVNVGSIANTSTDEFVVRRAGNYAVWLDAHLTSMATVATNIILTAFTSSRLFLGDEQTTIMVSVKLNLGFREVGLAAGGAVYFECYHNNGGPRAAGTMCRARIREML